VHLIIETKQGNSKKEMLLMTKPTILSKFSTRKTSLSASIFVALFLQACGSSSNDNDEPDEPVNAAPTASASASSSNVSVGDSSTVELFSTDSSDPDGDVLTFSWTQSSGSQVNLENADTETASFNVPTITEAETLEFELTVTDTGGETSTAKTFLLVQPLLAQPQ